jgi:uncharacterized damage-inducible protein DinB
MTVAELQTLYDYSYWANAKLREPLSRLTPDEFTRTVAGGWESVRGTLVHMMSAEGGWLERAGGPVRGARLNPDDFPTLDTISTYWAPQEQRMRAFLGALPDAALAERLEFTIPGFPGTRSATRGEMLHHAVNHNIHHRGQVTLLLRLLGQVPGNVDILFYFHDSPAPA